MKKIFTKFDIIGFKFILHFKSENKYKTPVGGCLTLLIFILTILAIVSFGDDIFRKINPTILLNKNFIEPELNLTQNIVIGYRLFYTGGIKIEELDRLVDIFILHSVFDPKYSKASLTRYEMIKCNDSDVYKYNYLNLTSLIGKPEDYFCFPNNSSIYLKGKYGSPINNHMHMRINICKNTTENKNKCYPSNVIRKKLSSFFVSFIYRDSYVDGTDYYNPVKYYITSNTLKSSAFNFRQDAYLYKELLFKTDSGLILQSEDTTSHIQLDNILSSSTADSETETFTNVIIGLNNIRDYYIRRYLKIQDVSAQVGGIIKFFLIISEFIVKFCSYYPLLDDLYDSIYDFKLLHRFKEYNDKKINNNSQVELNFHDNKLNNKKLIINKNFLNKINSERNLFYLSKLFRCITKKKNKFNYYEKISNHYKKNLSIDNFLNYNEKINSIYDFTFNKSEQQAVKLCSICKFYEIPKENNSDLDDFNMIDLKILDKFKTPKNKCLFNNLVLDNSEINEIRLNENI